MTLLIPTIDEATPGWLSRALAEAGCEAKVASVTASPVGTGQMGSSFRLDIAYERGDGPSRLFVKLASADAGTQAHGALGTVCEATFYREYADRLNIPLPACYVAEVDETGTKFTLLLEDLAPAEQGDQIAGCTIAEAEAAALCAAGLHAPTWNDPSIKELHWPIPSLALVPDFVADLLADATPRFLERHEVQPDTAAVLEEFTDRFARWAVGRPEPFSFLHADYRLDNLLFSPDGAVAPPVTVDWQVLTVGLPLRDIGLLVGTGLQPDDRREGEHAIVDAYHRRLMELGVEGYEQAQCWDDYRFGLFQGPVTVLLGTMVAQDSERGDRMFTVMADRSATAIADLDAFALL